MPSGPFDSQQPFGTDGPPFQGTPAYDTAPRIVSLTPNAGRSVGGTSVTISGFNFRYSNDGSAPIIQFGGSTATSVVVVDRNTITCITSAHAVGVVNVFISIQSQTFTLASAFTYVKATIVSLFPSYGPIAGGTTVLIAGINFQTASTYAVTFGGSAATDVTVFDTGHISVVTPNHALGFVDVIINDGVESSGLRNGFQYTLLTRGEDIRRQPGINIRDVLNNAPNTCSFRVDGQSNIPKYGEKIEIVDQQDGDRLMFAGTVLQIDQEYEEITNQLVWSCTAQDFTWLLNKYYPIGSFKNMSASDVVKALAKFAPGFDFTTYIQTNLAKVTAEFDGSLNFSACLNAIAEAIGGGHWYVDYQMRLHFFHPPLTNSFIVILLTGPGTSATLAEGIDIASVSSFKEGFYALWVSFVYDNGIETALSPLSNFVAMQGTKQFSVSTIPTGAVVGTHVCTKRRIYYQFIGEDKITPVAKFCEIPNNVTVAFTSNFGSAGSSVATIVDIAASVPLPSVPVAAPPAAPTPAPSAAQGVAAIFRPQSPPLIGRHVAATFTPGPWAFKVSVVYQNGTESLPSPSSNMVVLDGITSASLSNIPIGTVVNGVPVLGRKIYASFGQTNSKPFSQVVAELQDSVNRHALFDEYAWIIGVLDARRLQDLGTVPTNFNDLALLIGFGDTYALMESFTDPDWSPEHTRMWYFIADNTTTQAEIGPGTGENTPPNSGEDPKIPIWPNPDGPYLENFNLPDDLNSSNVLLLRDQPLRMSVDSSQVRNRVNVRGGGTVVVYAAIVGALELQVADCAFFSPSGGLLITDYRVLFYTGLTAKSGPGKIKLRDPLTVAVADGANVRLFFQAEDRASQAVFAAAELDVNGVPTDGVHEYNLDDTSLANPFQLFMRAYAELELFSMPTIRLTYSTRDPKTRSGATINVDLTNPPVKGEFLIQDVSIDQFHDESDALTPRYNVTATSVKFDLNDLLLKIITANISPSLSGVVAVTQINESVASGTVDTARDANMYVHGGGGVTTPSYQQTGSAVASALGATAAFDPTEIETDNGATNFSWATFTTAASVNSTSGVGITGGPWRQLERTFDLIIQVKTPVDLTNIRLWAGLALGTGIPNGLTPTNQAAVTFRYIAGTDVGWTSLVQPLGVGAPATTNAIASIQPSKVYILRIKSTPDSASFAIDGVAGFTTVSRTDTNLPLGTGAGSSGSGLLAITIGVSTPVNVIKKFSFRMLRCRSIT